MRKSKRTVQIAELKAHLSRYIAEVRSGAELIVRDRETPVARIVPLLPEADGDVEMKRLIASGRIRPPQKQLPSAFLRTRGARVKGQVVLRLLRDERDER